MSADIKIPNSLPWRVDGHDIIASGGSCVAENMLSSEAAYLVHAANHYPKLVDALKPLAAIAERYDEDEDYSAPDQIGIDDLRAARAALQTAGVKV